MKQYNARAIIKIKLLGLLFAFSAVSTYSQNAFHIGISGGYSIADLSEINADLNDTYQALWSSGLRVESPKEASGGKYFEGTIFYQSNKLFIGPSVDYFDTKGSVTYSDFSGSAEETYEMDLATIMMNIGSYVPLNPTINMAFRIGGGVGFSSVKHVGRIVVYSPDYYYNMTHLLKGSFFVARFQFGFEILLENVRLNLSSAYRLANAGVLSGTGKLNGVPQINGPIYDARGGEIEFNYSGFTFTGGISFEL